MVSKSRLAVDRPRATNTAYVNTNRKSIFCMVAPGISPIFSKPIFEFVGLDNFLLDLYGCLKFSNDLSSLLSLLNFLMGKYGYHT